MPERLVIGQQVRVADGIYAEMCGCVASNGLRIPLARVHGLERIVPRL